MEELAENHAPLSTGSPALANRAALHEHGGRGSPCCAKQRHRFERVHAVLSATIGDDLAALRDLARADA